MSPEEIIRVARTWIGTPWLHQGRQKGLGVDCLGLVLGVIRELGLGDLDNPEWRRYGRSPPRGSRLLEVIARELGEPLSRPPEVGDVLVFWIDTRNRRPQHLGISTGDAMVHGYSTFGAVVESQINAWWRERFLAAHSLPRVPLGAA